MDLETYHANRRQNMFNKLCDPNDWRAPFTARVHVTQLAEAIQAVIYFVGERPTTRHLPGTVEMYEVESVGYRNGPCGP